VSAAYNVLVRTRTGLRLQQHGDQSARGILGALRAGSAFRSTTTSGTTCSSPCGSTGAVCSARGTVYAGCRRRQSSASGYLQRPRVHLLEHRGPIRRSPMGCASYSPMHRPRRANASTSRWAKSRLATAATVRGSSTASLSISLDRAKFRHAAARQRSVLAEQPESARRDLAVQMAPAISRGWGRVCRPIRRSSTCAASDATTGRFEVRGQPALRRYAADLVISANRSSSRRR
jgi:hypothetical protein